MADLTVQINEKITLDGNDRGVFTSQVITGINGVDNRLLTIPTGSYTTLFYFADNNIDAAVFPTGSFKYGRVTNKSTTDIQLVIFAADTTNMDYIITPGNSFTLSSTSITGSAAYTPNNFNFNTYIYSISAAPLSSSATVEYFIATT
jgi:hypothetical protein